MSGVNVGRGFTFHQRVVLEVDFAGIITASAHLTIVPTQPSLRTLYLHASPLLNISACTLSSPGTSPLPATETSFTLSNPFQPLPYRDPPIDIKSHPELKRKTWASMTEREQGELAVSVSGGWVRIVEADNGAAFAPIHLKIDYELVVGGEAVEGIVFRRPGDAGDENQTPHMFLSPTAFDAARCWVPCVDSLWERCTWELEIIVPRYLEEAPPADQPEDRSPVQVVASGELVEQIIHPDDADKVIFYYLQPTPTSVQHISFAAGPFEIHSIPVESPASTSTDSQPAILAFCLPGALPMLRNSTNFLGKAMAFYTTEFGSYPFSSYKAVFVSNPHTQATTSASLSILSSDLLYPTSVVDQAIETRQVLSLALISQWVGINIIQKTLADTWLINGLALYIASLFLRSLLGNNEWRFRLKKDINRCASMDSGEQHPICVPGTIDPHDAPTLTFMNLKAPLVLHILDRKLSQAGSSLGLSRVIPKVFLSSLSGELQNNMLSTHAFMRTCRKVSGLDLTAFQDQWIYGSGCPQLTVRAGFVKKKFIVELQVQQTVPAAAQLDQLYPEKVRTATAWKKPAQFFDGTLTVRIHEADGAPYEHVVDIREPTKRFDLPFNTKYKRTRRTGRILARPILAVGEGDEEPEEVTAPEEDNNVFNLPMWEEDEQREKWRVGDWSEADAERIMTEGYEWIRIDPECDWLATINFQQDPWYWVSQLGRDHDVVAQLEAIENLRMYPSHAACSALTRTALITNYYYRVRMEAIKALKENAVPTTDYLGLFHILKLYQHFFCHPPETETLDPFEIQCKPRPNDFSNFVDYFVQKALISTMGGLVDQNGGNSVWRNVRQLLVDLLRYNDNTHNKFSDSYYLATIIGSLGNALAVTAATGYSPDNQSDRALDQALLKEAVDTIDRHMTMDRLVPSFHNLVSVAGLQLRMKCILTSAITSDPRPFLTYTREGNYVPLRLVAFDCVMLCKPPGRSQPLTRYIFDVIQHDHSLVVRRHVARAVSESFLVTLALGDIPGLLPPPAIVDDRVDLEKKQEQDGQALVKGMRKDASKRTDLKEMLQSGLLESMVQNDNAIRFAFLKMAEIASSSASEPPPGMVITIPNTPSVEVPTMATPKIRLSLSAQDGRASESNGGYGFPSVPERASPSLPIKLVLGNKKKKEKPVPKEQQGGLSDNDAKAVAISLRKLMSTPKSAPFRIAVDPIRDSAPSYLTIIKHPMDLGTIQAKFSSGMYKSRDDYAADVRLIVTNACTYNTAGSPMFQAAKAFEETFERMWSATERTLKKSSALSVDNSRWGTSDEMPPPAPPAAAGLMPPPPVPTASIKLKVKTKPPTTDQAIAALLPEEPAPRSVPSAPSRMSPPPIPRATERQPDRQSAPITPAASLPSAPVVDLPTKKRKKENSKPMKVDAVDDLLSEEIDAMERVQAPSLEDELLGPPQPKKIKLQKPPASHEKEKRPKEKLQPQAPAPTSASNGDSVRIKLNKKPSSRPAVTEVVPTAPVAAVGAPVSQRPPRPADLPPTTKNMMPFNAKRAKLLHSTLTRNPLAFIFLQPVDPIRDGCPTYFTEISHPMDFGTIGRKIDQGLYRTMGDFANDVELVFNNCRQFNPPGPITDLANQLEAAFWKEWPRAVANKLQPDEKRLISGLLTKARLEPSAIYFLEAVDPVALNIPKYFEIIPEEDARDLSLIKKKLDNDKYANFHAVDDDIELMLDNARAFNDETTEVVRCANVLGRWWRNERQKMDRVDKKKETKKK